MVLQASRSNAAEITGTGTSESKNLQENLARLYRWRINLVTGDVSERTLSGTPCYFTRVNDDYARYKTRYVFAGIFDTERAFTFDGVMKYDCESGVTSGCLYGPNSHGGEAAFAPKIGIVSEDDGSLLCFVHDEAENHSECQIIDARHVTVGPVALIIMPFRVPFASHAGWVGAE